MNVSVFDFKYIWVTIEKQNESQQIVKAFTYMTQYNKINIHIDDGLVKIQK